MKWNAVFRRLIQLHYYRKKFENEIPNELKPAYFQLIHYQVAASSAMSRKILYAQKSRLYVETNVELAGYYAQLATDAYNEITALDYTYNRDMQNGKWNTREHRPSEVR